MLPLWADALILLAVPLIMLAVLWKWGGGDPDNGITHHQEDEDDPPDSSDEEGRPGLLAA